MSFKFFLWKGCFSLLLLPPFPALCSFLEFYETCDWKNQAFTNRIIKEAYSYCPLDEKDDLSQCMVSDPLFPTLLCSGKGVSCGPSPVEEIQDLKNIVFREQILGSQIPKECFLASQMLGKNLWPAEDNTYYYCHSSHADKLLPHITFEGCQAENDTTCKLKESQSPPKPVSRTLPPRPPCLSPSYIHLTSRAFNQVTDCFGFTGPGDKARLFALFHHESRFLLNKVEEYNKKDGKIINSTNRCFGQMKNTFIETLNKYIYFGDRNRKGPRESSWYHYGDIYRESVRVCPFLKEVLTPSPSLLRGTALHPEDTFAKAHKDHSQSMMCRTSQDPYSCLFYAVFNAKANLKDMTITLKREETLTLPEKDPDSVRGGTIPTTLKPNEMLMASDPSGEGALVPIQESVVDISGVNLIPDRGFKKVPLFRSEEELKWAFVLYAHNGGSDIIKENFSEFIQELKDKITQPGCEADPVCRGYRVVVLKGEGLKTSVLYEEFAQYAERNQIVNYEELSQFMKKIHQDTAYLANSRGALKRAALHLQPAKDRDLKQDNMDRFLDHIKKVCPTRL